MPSSFLVVSETSFDLNRHHTLERLRDLSPRIEVEKSLIDPLSCPFAVSGRVVL
jgi:hypothetical protein